MARNSSSSGRGFAAMDPEQQREIASKGGRASHQSGNAHEFDSEGAAEAGRKGGLASHHRNAAFYHEAAAHHHRQAARHHESGDEEEGNRHAEEAHRHSTRAHGHSQNSRRGFAGMDEDEQREVARKGGRSSNAGPQRIARRRRRGAEWQPGTRLRGHGTGRAARNRKSRWSIIAWTQ